MRILVLNAGSSTLKTAVFDARGNDLLECRRAVEPLGTGQALQPAIERALETLGSAASDVSAVGHRLVHGGRRFREATQVDAAVEAELEELAPLAPLHQSIALEVLRAARGFFPGRPQLAVFDTAFHASRSGPSLHYALPDSWTRRFGLYRYGFHGLAHASLVDGLARQRGVAPGEIDAVTLQLGHGCSACAVRGGRSIETSMGFTPLEGLVMGTRSGDVDPGVLLHLLRSGIDVAELESALQKDAGLLGLSGHADMRQLLAAVERADVRASSALDLFVHRIVLKVGGYLTLLGGPRPLVFGGGIGEHAALVRTRVVAGLRAFGMELDPAANQLGEPGAISRAGATAVHIVATDEEVVIAREVARALSA